MNELTNNELMKVEGGGYKLVAGISAIIILVTGIFDGYRNPLKCNNR